MNKIFNLPASQEGHIESLARANWDSDVNLHDEFPGFETYLAYRKAMAGGVAKLSSVDSDGDRPITIDVNINPGNMVSTTVSINEPPAQRFLMHGSK